MVLAEEYHLDDIFYKVLKSLHEMSMSSHLGVSLMSILGLTQSSANNIINSGGLASCRSALGLGPGTPQTYAALVALLAVRLDKAKKR